jgi:hypothetical protein
MRANRAELMGLKRAARSEERAKLRREVFAMHAKGVPCHVGSCCEEERGDWSEV